ncbi:cbb3-type cytochrome oxidase subunit 3 [Chitinilyticum piscinae]|uniref:Cbb3-type cytochrome c oxidase subunit 3 n=1 Tax=Chitinilyticum piscinae TaxID=2866724 RepID=A0A8J7FI46_9NEIS|nr:cbb3-type cytochrome c oxidase subunit 3 [Chitinilyticum piscinae]MBE9609700.1 cbb3-type cytochrome c oxidase subunit 3 [Chitinilyticum piscinae]
MDMQNDLRIIVTVLGMLCFLAICIWAYGKRSKTRFDEIAEDVIKDDDSPSASQRS